MQSGKSKSNEADSQRAPAWWLSPKGRAVLSVLLFLHLLAVVGEPLRMFSQGRQPASPDAQIVRRGLGPYIDFLYLHHGYFFFAPNPGPSHLMDIRLSDADGSVRHLRLPNHRAQWPRLLYHRHFMLSEFLYQLYTPQPSAAEVNAALPIRQAWQRDRELFERVRGSMQNHLAKRYGAQSAEIQLMEHRLPNAVEVFDQQLKLDDEQFYILLPDYPPADVEESLPPAAAPSRPSAAAASSTAPTAGRGAENTTDTSSASGSPGRSPGQPASASPRGAQPRNLAPQTAAPRNNVEPEEIRP